MNFLNNPEHYKFEDISCYSCGDTNYSAYMIAQDDYTGKPGNFRFVQCKKCNLIYQNPRISIDQIASFYDQEYIAHRKKTNWGMLTRFYNWAMNKHDIDKESIVKKYVKLDTTTKALDVGCAVGTFLIYLNAKYRCSVSGVDFQNLSSYPGFDVIKFYNGLFYEEDFKNETYDLITMWHFLEHDYNPYKSLCTASRLLTPEGRLVIEVPRLDSLSSKMYGKRWPGVQAPQHTVIFTKQQLLNLIDKADLEVVDYLSYGAFPPYFYFFAGLAFAILRGKGLNLSKLVAPYFLGQLLTFPIFLFEKHLNLSMQTVICKKRC